jgi:hypothetical protein
MIPEFLVVILHFQGNHARKMTLKMRDSSVLLRSPPFESYRTHIQWMSCQETKDDELSRAYEAG